MVILGAKGHALEITDILLNNNPDQHLYYFDDVSPVTETEKVKGFPVIRSLEKLAAQFLIDDTFVLGTGNPRVRRKLSELGAQAGGRLVSVISSTAYVSKRNVTLGTGLNIMHGVIVQPEVSIGSGTLINAGVLIHHQSTIGSYCEICPGAIITGNVHIGDNTFIGAGATVLPGIKIGCNVKVGSGAVVINDLEDNVTVIGNPALKKTIPN